MEQPPIRELTVAECWALLRAQSFGRLAAAAAGEIDLYPINYVVDEETIVFRTAPGTKLLELTVSSRIAFEIDRIDTAEAMSVVLKGHARRLDTGPEIDAAATLPLHPLIATVKPEFVRIQPDLISGRRFRLGPEPESSLV